MTGDGGHAGRPLWVDLVIIALAFVVFVTLLLLGNWQMRRLEWKLDLTEAVETRAYGDPVSVEGLVQPPEYLRVVADGTWRHDLALRVKAVTELGAGSWVMTPLEGADRTVWVNRGFVPSGLDPTEWTRPEGPVEVTGLVRESRPGGTLLESNDPEAGRWVSADIPEMSRTAGINAARYFIDADHQGEPAAWPRGGLTKLEFRNTHLSYALTWYAMAALFLGAMAYVIRQRVRKSGVVEEQ
ncbi:SURF1 family protein [Amaricoccus tamworthensis]|uniref:SURF1 family protein n=1 Tax=Amaricoccus tamworthensis TaxID=57002 RepID=UPI003C7A13CD